jgi:hypothetical protein
MRIDMQNFVFRTTLEFFWPVTVKLPSQTTPGAFDAFSFEVQLAGLDRSVMRKHAERASMTGSASITGQDIGQTAAPETAEDAALKEMVTGWRGIVDEAGQPIAFSPSALDQLLDLPWVRRGLWTAVYEAASGEAARKN